MDIKLLSKNMDLVDSIEDYILKRVTNVGRLLSKIEKEGGEVKVNFEVSRNTKHKSGLIFHSDCVVNINGKRFYVSSDKPDIFEAIDDVKNTLFKEISKSKEKIQTLNKRGAKNIKKIIKETPKRNKK